MLTDTHTHLYYEADAQKRGDVLKRAIDAGVGRLFLPNVNAGTVQQVFELTERYPGVCFAMAGLHPCDVKPATEEGIGIYTTELEILHQAAKHKDVVAIGEIGIDLYWDKTTLAIQQDAFKQQVDWAIELDLPIVIHSRESFDEVYQVLLEKKHERLRGIFHCFTGSMEQAEKAIGLGFWLGIGGVVTYKKSGLGDVVKHISLQHIVLETDSPYLAPVPYRGKQNESSFLIYIAQKVADLHQISVEELARITTENSIKIFGV